MPKKSDRREDEEILRIRIFQWEFLRRNLLYNEDYRRIIKTFGTWFEAKGYWYDRSKPYSPADFVFFVNHVFPLFKEICAKWQISDPFSPDWIFDSHGFKEYAPGRIVYVPTGQTPESAAHLWEGGPIRLAIRRESLQPFESPFRPLLEAERQSRPHFHRQRRMREPRYLQLTFDATLSTPELIRQLKQKVEFHRRKHEEFFVTHLERSRRRRLGQYPLYLKAWDLRSRGKSFSEIAREMYPREYSQYPARKNPLVQRVTDHYTRAQELVDGGYKELR